MPGALAPSISFHIQCIQKPGEPSYATSSADSVEVLDDSTIKIVQKYPSRLLLSALASYSLIGLMMIFPASYDKWGPKDLMHHPAGTGPFMFDKWESGRFIRLKRNPN